jgi:hypothetical protein
MLYYADETLRGGAVVRVEAAHDGRFEVVELFVAGSPVTTDHLRQIPLGRIEARANEPTFREFIVNSLDLPRLTFEAVIESEKQSHAQAADRTQRRKRTRSARLPVPKGRKYPDSFYMKVAEVYAALVQAGERPAADMAEANDVQVTVVHRWVKEARRRGFLAPGRAGKAG